MSSTLLMHTRHCQGLPKSSPNGASVIINVSAQIIIPWTEISSISMQPCISYMLPLAVCIYILMFILMLFQVFLHTSSLITTISDPSSSNTSLLCIPFSVTFNSLRGLKYSIWISGATERLLVELLIVIVLGISPFLLLLLSLFVLMIGKSPALLVWSGIRMDWRHYNMKELSLFNWERWKGNSDCVVCEELCSGFVVVTGVSP